MTKPTPTPVMRQMQMASMLNRQQMRPRAKPQNPLQFCSAHGVFPVCWADLIFRTETPTAIHVQLHPQRRARSRLHGFSIKGANIVGKIVSILLLNVASRHHACQDYDSPMYSDWHCKHTSGNENGPSDSAPVLTVSKASMMGLHFRSCPPIVHSFLRNSRSMRSLMMRDMSAMTQSNTDAEKAASLLYSL